MSFLSAIGGGVDASGGTTVTTFTDSGGTQYQIHAFENVGTNTFTVNSGGEVDVLVVGGGGSGGTGGNGGYEAGAGGAGELISQSGVSISSGSYNVTVGSGGTPSGSSGSGQNGGDSSFSPIGTADGGGTGGQDTIAGGDGGSGGGGGHRTAGAGDSTADIGVGHDGAFGGIDQTNVGGGGGGAAEPGGIKNPDASSGSTTDNQTEGGDGLDLSNTFGTTFGDSGAFAGGGQGANYNNLSDTDRVRSLGGGGISNSSLSGGDTSKLDAIQNTGSGGAGSYSDNASVAGGGGGSGIVLIRYEI